MQHESYSTLEVATSMHGHLTNSSSVVSYSAISSHQVQYILANPICKAFRCKESTYSELLSFMHLLNEVCPYFKFGYMAANGAIAEGVKDENNIHIIAFWIAEGNQWFTLIQAFLACRGGPHITWITDVDASSALTEGQALKSCRII